MKIKKTVKTEITETKYGVTILYTDGTYETHILSGDDEPLKYMNKEKIVANVIPGEKVKVKKVYEMPVETFIKYATCID